MVDFIDGVVVASFCMNQWSSPARNDETSSMVMFSAELNFQY